MKLRHLTLAALLAVVTSWAAAPADAQLSTPLDDETLEQFRWRSVGPANMMGRVTDVEGIPGPSKTFYVASVAGGIWKTTNNGVTFRPLFQDERVVAMGDIAIAPSDTLQIWAGTGEEDSRNSISPGGGIYKSVDGGLTWELKGLEETEVIGRIVVHPTDPDIVWVAALGHIWDHNPERGLYRTTDGGDTWERVKFVSDRAGFVDVAIHPRNPDVLFASSWERVRGPYFLESGGPGSALWKTTDGGDTWTEVEGSGFPTTTKGRIGLAISRSDPDVVYAMVEAEEDETEEDDAEEDEAEEGTGDELSGGNGLYRSTDGGATWEQMNDTNTRPFYYSQVRVDPADPDRVYYSSTPVRVSNDGGRTEGTTTIGVHVDHHALWIDPSDPDRMVAGNDGGIGITFDRGGNWWVPNTIALGQFYHVSYNMDVPYRVCGGLQDNGTWCGPSRVARGDVTNHHWATISGGDGFYSAQDPEDPNLIWAESQGGNMARINMATGERNSLRKPSWEDVWRPRQDSVVLLLEEGVPEDDPRIVGLRERASADSTLYQLRWNWSTPFLQSAHDRSVFYAAANVVLKSTEWGDDLRAVSPDLTYADTMKIRVSTRTTGGITRDVTGAETHATIVALAESPLRPGWLYAGTDDGRVWMTRSDGGEWTELTDRFSGVPEGTWVSRVEPSHHEEDRFYVTFDGHRTNDFTPYVYVTDDGGRTFRSIASDLPTGKPDFVHVVREDPHNPDLLFVGTDVGAYVSTDRGASWQRFMNGLPTSPVHDLKIHPRDRELIAATHGRSIWIVDIAPLEQLTDRVMAEGAALFDVGPAFQWGGPAVGGESTGQAFFERPTPGSGARIQYFVGDEVASNLVAADEGSGMSDRESPREGGLQPSGEPGGGARRGGAPQVEVTVTGSDGEVVATLNGPATAGLHSVSWNVRGPPPPPEPLSPSERRDSVRTAERAVEVRDSLLAEGWEEEPLRRMIGLFTGETDRDELFGGGGGRGGGGFGGGRGARDPEAFVERPGESFGGGGRGGGRGGFGGFGGMDVDELREVAELVRSGGGLGGLFGRGRGGPGSGELVDPGTYTVTLTVGERSFTKEMRVERMPGMSTDADTPEELEWEAMWRRFLEGEGWD